MRLALAFLVGLLCAPSARAASEALAGSPRVGGDDCSAALDLSCRIPRTLDRGTTAGANDTVTQLVGGCQGLVTVPGPDVIYRLSLGNQDIFAAALRVVPAAGYDVAIYLLRGTAPGCPTGVFNFATNCVAAANAGGPGVIETIPVTALLSLPGGTYYFFIDSPVATGPSSTGTYEAQLVSLCPVELIDFSIE